jgi:hypothetical protein
VAASAEGKGRRRCRRCRRRLIAEMVSVVARYAAMNTMGGIALPRTQCFVEFAS